MPVEASLPEKILRDYDRLGLDDRFTFRCGPQMPCFTRCCRDVAIVLTPYDVLRMKKALGISSEEFLERYAILPFTREQKIPVVLLKMDPQTRRCPFVGPGGCTLYAHRPWACRMYPLGVADPKNPSASDRRFHFLLQEDFCLGHGQGDTYTVREWLEREGVEEYEMMGASFRDLMLDEFWERGPELTPEQMEMYFMACYDLDRFRRFVFETKFLELFDVDEARIEALRTDDLELLDFAIAWLRFSLFRQRTLRIRRSALEARRAGQAAPKEARAHG
jgi:Fe-S-cluster containining protein